MEDVWVCMSCTAHNVKASISCSVCDQPQFQQPPPLTTQSGPLPTWTCSSCTLQNPLSSAACELCRADRSTAVGDTAFGAIVNPMSMSLDEAVAQQLADVESARALQAQFEREEQDRAAAAALRAADELEALLKREEDEAAGRAAASALHAQTLEAVEAPCALCLCEARISDMFTLDCEAGHRYCFECIRRQVKVNLAERSMATCAKCPHQLTPLEMRQLFGADSAELSQYEDIGLRNHMAAHPTLYVPCPGADCGMAYAASAPGAVEHCACTACGTEFCSRCKGPFHGFPAEPAAPAAEGGAGGPPLPVYARRGVTCDDAAAVLSRWHAWLGGERAAYLTRIGDTRAAAERALDAATQAAMARFAEHQASEAMKEANCRVCPACGKPVEKLSGCDLMVCGSDYHGGNQQAGCGRAFNWNAAPRYVRPGGEAARVPRSFEEVGFREVGTARHPLPGHEGAFRRCDACRKEIAGPRFSCIHCAAGLECCDDCSINGAALAALGHAPTHAFRVVMPGGVA